MSDKIYISGSAEDIESRYYLLPSEYDNGYMHSTTPYHFQNLINSIVSNNDDIIKSEISQGISGQNLSNLLRWIKIINTEDYPLEEENSEFNAIFEKDYAKKFGDWLNDNFKYNNNRDLLALYTVSPAMMRQYGYDESDDKWAILYPQFGLFWNTFYNQYFGIWYTPIKPNGSIFSKTAAVSYIESLNDVSNYYKADINSIILRVDTELGFTVFDIQKLSIGVSSERVTTKLTDLKSWCDALTEVQVYYQLLVEASNDTDLLENYIFIDENKSIFNTVRKNYFLFNVKPIDYFNDLDENIDYQQLDYWDADTDYNAGDIVLGSVNSDTMRKNAVYRCVHSHVHNGAFELIVPIEVVTSTGEKGTDYVDQWEFITNEYAKELAALQDTMTAVGKQFNKDDYIRFVIPDIEDLRPVEYYTNGDVKPNQQQGLVAWPDGEGFTLRQITHVRLDPQYFVDHAGDSEYPTPAQVLEYRTIWIKDDPTQQEIEFLETWKPKVNKIPRLYYKDYKNICWTHWSSDSEEKKKYDWDLVEPMDDHLVEESNWKNQLDDTYSSPTSSSVASMNTNGKIVHYFKKATLSKDGTLIPVAIQAKLRSIKDEAFKGRKELLKVVLRSSLTRIGTKAFSDCPNLSQVILPKNLKVLGLNAFSACTSLRRATVPRNVTILSGTYAGCTNLETVVLSEKCTEIGASTFVNCKSLKKVYNTKNLQVIGDNAFNGCEELLDFTFPEKVTVLSTRAFKGCRKCKFDISEIRNSVEYLGEGCFQDCEQLDEVISFENITTLYPNSYKNCKNITSIVFNLKPISDSEREEGPNGSKLNAYIIPSNFCYGCSRLLTINLQGVEQLDDSCFENCCSLTNVVIPLTVNLIGKRIFYDCFQMGRLTVPTSCVKGNTSIYGSWIESVLTPENKDNWVDRVFTRVYNANGVELHW